ncbi:MAG: FHA domain-containing protein [Chloroflexota bacterium]
MSVDEWLLVGRIAFLAALYLFLVLLALLLWRELRQRNRLGGEERAPADLMVVEPADTGLEAGERIPLLAVSSVGRGDENDVNLFDGFVSSEHARLAWNGRGWVLEDLGSTNGTRVNGKVVKRALPIAPGDLIEFGRVKVKLVTI